MKSWVKILLSVVSGIIFGLSFGDQYSILSYTGAVFIDLVKIFGGILVFSSVVSGICHYFDPKKFGKVGQRVITLAASTMILFLVVGLLSTFLMKPGPDDDPMKRDVGWNGLLQLISSYAPSNPFTALAEGNIIQVIICALFLALALTISGEKRRMILISIEFIGEFVGKVTRWIMKLAPLGLFAIIATVSASNGSQVIFPVTKFFLCNFIAYGLPVGVLLTLLSKFFAHTPFAKRFVGLRNRLFTSLTPVAAGATPSTAEPVRGKSDDISAFILALASTVNIGGLALSQAFPSLFFTQFIGLELTQFQSIVLVTTALLSVVGSVGMSGQNMVMLSFVLNSVGLQLEGITLLTGIDRIRVLITTFFSVIADAVALFYVVKKDADGSKVGSLPQKRLRSYRRA